MKKRIVCIAVLTAALIMLAMPLTSDALDAAYVNNNEVYAGDVVKYEVYIGDVEKPLIGVRSTIEFDHEFLEYIEGSAVSGVFENPMFSIDNNQISFSGINIYGADFKKEQLYASISFKVLDGAKGETLITHKMEEIYYDEAAPDLTPSEYKLRTQTLVHPTYETGDEPHAAIDGNTFDPNSTDLGEMMLGTDAEQLKAQNESAAQADNSNVVVIIVCAAFGVLAGLGVVLAVVLKKRKSEKE